MPGINATVVNMQKTGLAFASQLQEDTTMKTCGVEPIGGGNGDDETDDDVSDSELLAACNVLEAQTAFSLSQLPAVNSSQMHSAAPFALSQLPPANDSELPAASGFEPLGAVSSALPVEAGDATRIADSS